MTACNRVDFSPCNSEDYRNPSVFSFVAGYVNITGIGYVIYFYEKLSLVRF